jgi:hypothetical protein
LVSYYGIIDFKAVFRLVRTIGKATRDLKRIILIVIGIFLTLWNSAGAFHSKGTANCDGCHTVHNSQEGFPVDPTNPQGNEWLLLSATPSDVCLSCHADRLGAVFGNDPLAPPPEKGGGNFVFLLAGNLNDSANGALNPIPGSAGGHSINAPSRGVGPDATYLTAPGGTFPSEKLGCTSCHDPHGNGNFRMLYGSGSVQDETATFAFPAPQAIGIDLTSGSETATNHTAYVSGMSAWCSNCHTGYRDNHAGAFTHPTDINLSAEIVRQYNAYNGTADSAGGNFATAYLVAVPFEDQSNSISSTTGPSTSSKLTCLSCHRAHATSAPHAGRWDFNVTLLSQDGVVSGSYPIPDPYNSPTQTGLCYKCHVSGTVQGTAEIR